MKVNEIRKLAKEVRTGSCALGYDEANSLYAEMVDYVNSEVADGWTDKTKAVVESDMKDIAGYVVLVAPVEVAEEAVEPEGDTVPETEADATANERDGKTEEVVRKNFKTVLFEMAGKRYPTLEAARWFSKVYARDGYEKFKCLKGMLTRRGYELVIFTDGFAVLNHEGNKEIALVENNDGLVGEFEIVED